MEEKTIELFDGLNEMLKLACGPMQVNDLKNMSSEDFKIMQLTLKLIDTSKEIFIEEAKAMERIEKKLDKLLSKKESN